MIGEFGLVFKNHKKTKQWLCGALIFLLLLLLECVFFRNIIMTGTGALIGDRGDGRLTMLLTEHWWNFVTGKEKFSELSFFYPQNNVMGYTDMFLGYGIIHVVMRFLGFDMWNSYKWTLVMVHFLGVISTYYLIHNKLRCKVYWALCGTIMFSFSNALSIHLGHTQLAAIGFLPLLLIIFIGYCDSIDDTFKRNMYAILFIILFVLLSYTAWYVACFTGVYCLVFCIVYLTFIMNLKNNYVRDIKKLISDKWIEYVLYFFVTIILYIPFIIVYLPAMRQTSGFGYKEACVYMPEPADIINVGSNNLLFGWLIKQMGFDDRCLSTEVIIGFSVFVVLLFVICCYYVIHYEKENIIIKSIVLSTIICIFSVIKLSSNGISLWYLFYTFIPVVRSMRAVGRFLLWLSFPISIFIAYILNSCFVVKCKKKLIFAWLLVIMVFISNMQVTGVSSGWNYREEKNNIESVSRPPKDIGAFYIIDTLEYVNLDVRPTNPVSHVDAFEVANYYNIKTINGYSGKEPEGWHGIWDIYAIDYECNVSEWAKKNNLKNIYAYDRSADEWIPLDIRLNQIKTDVFCPKDNKYSVNSGLNGCGVGEYIWTAQNFSVNLKNERIKNNGLQIKLVTRLEDYKTQTPDIDPYIDIYVDGELISREEVADGEMDLYFPMSEHDSDEYTITISTNCYWNPKELGQSEDGRDLSLALYYIGDYGM